MDAFLACCHRPVVCSSSPLSCRDRMLQPQYYIQMWGSGREEGHFPLVRILLISYSWGEEAESIMKQFSAMDVLARATMKDAVKCETQCELQNSGNHQISERKWRCRDNPCSTSVSVSLI